MNTLRFVGHLPRSNKDMLWCVDCPWKSWRVVSFYFATIEDVLATYPEFTDRVPEVAA